MLYINMFTKRLQTKINVSYVLKIREKEHKKQHYAITYNKVLTSSPENLNKTELWKKKFFLFLEWTCEIIK